MEADRRIGSVALTFREGVQLETVHKALAELIKNLAPGNCTACGFQGLDLIIRAGDPEVFRPIQPIREFDDVLDTSFTRRPLGF